MFMRSLNLHQLTTFQVVAKHCSFVRAAEELHFSQPAVSAQIRHLEKPWASNFLIRLGARRISLKREKNCTFIARKYSRSLTRRWKSWRLSAVLIMAA